MTYVPHAVAFVAIVAAIYIVQPSVLNPVVWTEPFPLPELVGKLQPNELLLKTNKAGLGEAVGAESMAMNWNDGSVYASLSDGRIVHLSASGQFLSTLFFSGGYMATEPSKRTNGATLVTAQKMAWCHEEAKTHRLAWNKTGEKECGRPLGIRYLPGTKTSGDAFLYFIDTYYGLFRLNLRTKIAEHLLASDALISASDNVDPVVKSPMIFFNDLAVTDDGNEIFFSDTSYNHVRTENREELLDGAPRGRLFHFDVQSKVVTPLLCGLHFTNGVEFLNPFDRANSPLLVAETTRFRVLRVDARALLKAGSKNTLLQSCEEHGSLWTELQQQKKSKSVPASSAVSVFTDSIPGVVDNIRVDAKSMTAKNPEKLQFLFGLGTKSSKPFSLLWLGYQGTLLRDIVGKFLPMKFVEKLVPKYGFVLRVNAQGEVVGTLQDPTGKGVVMISEAQRNPVTGDLWMGSHSNPFIGILPAQFVPDI